MRVPGSKSITNRAYVLAALAAAPTRVRTPLDSRDARLMLGALTALGGRSEPTTDGYLVYPISSTGSGEPVSVALGNAGTVARFTPPLATLGSAPVLFDGDEAIRRRPIGPLLKALRDLGARIDDDGRDAPPFTVHGGGGLRGGRVRRQSIVGVGGVRRGREVSGSAGEG